MKIYNKDKTKELNRENLDLSKGYLTLEKEIIHHDKKEYVSEKGHYETIAKYSNGGKDVEWVIDIPEQQEEDAYDETIEYQRYIEYTKEELLIQKYEEEIEIYKKKLSDTDYLVIKFIEGWLDEKEYQDIKSKRQSYRDRINELQDEIKRLSK